MNLLCSTGKPIVLVAGDMHSWGAFGHSDLAYCDTVWEAAVPTLNVPQTNCTGGNGCGTWDGFVNTPQVEGQHYALFRVEAGRLTYEVHDGLTGSLVSSYTVSGE